VQRHKRKAHARCTRCGKIRKMWMRANEWSGQRISSRNVAGEGKVCWICRIREVDPNWRPGLPLPEVLNGQHFGRVQVKVKTHV
jgi:hypothetical protein